MAFPSVKLTTLASLAHRLPAACWLAQRLEQAPERWVTLPVWWVEGDLDMVALDLVTTLSSDGQWLPPLPSTALDGSAPHPDGALLWVDGHLRLQGALTGGWHTPASAAEPSSPAVHALVMGDAQVHCAMLRQAKLHVEGNLSVHTLLWGDGAPGGLTVLGQSTAQVGLFTRGYAPQWNQPPSFDFTLQDVDPAGDSALWQPADHETLGLVIPPQYLDADNAGTGSLAEMLNAPALVQAARAQQPVTQPTAAVHALLPPVPSFFQDESISVANIRAAVQSPLIAPKQFTAEGWFGQTDFSLCRKHVDSDGDARQDSVFITVWKQWDFYMGVDSPEPAQGWLGGGWSRLQRLFKRHGGQYPVVLNARSTGSTPGLVVLYRPYAQGVPGAWAPLAWGDEDGADPAAQRACQQAWRGVLDYVRKGTAQARAHHPLWTALHEEITPARLTALTSTPLFTERYNDWWDSEKNGLWVGQFWMGARQPCLHQGEPWGRAFKLSWKNGDDGPGDAPDNAHSAYQIDIEEAREGPPLLRVAYSQRQSEPRTPIPPGAADHLARLLRLYRQAQTHIERLTAAMAHEAQPPQHPAAQLLTVPPLAPDIPDNAVFGAEWMQRSDQWQTTGQAYAQQARAQLAAADAPPLQAMEHAAADTDLSLFGAAADAMPALDDPRAADAEAVLQLAREVHRHADANLAARFRQRFAFAPDALAAHAYRAGQPAGPVLLLDDDRAVVRVAQGGAHGTHWWLLQGLQATVVEGLHGAGRSPNRQCFAKFDGHQVTTHAGWDGPVITRLHLPHHAKAARPGTVESDEILPFNDGLRVLWRDATGVYLLTPDAAQQLYPRAESDEAADAPEHPDVQVPQAQPLLHMALSPDERFIAVGDQGGQHLLLNPRGEVLGRWAPLSACAHHATFTHDSTRLLAHSCHLYTGRTGVLHLPPKGTGGSLHAHPSFPGAAALQPFHRHSWRVDATATLRGTVIEGDAAGYLHALSDDGQLLWHHHIGGALNALDTSPDGTTIVAASHSGYVVWLRQLGAGMDPFAISTSPYTETGRWIFWQGEAQPLHW